MKKLEALYKSEIKPNIAKRIMCEFLGISFEELFLKQNEELQNEDEYFALCKRFKNGEPIEYIFSHCKFLGRDFVVNNSVLIPRDESEILVFKTIKIANNFCSPIIFDIGTGSGILAISLALAIKNAKIFASDISTDALKIAKKNASLLGAENIIFLQSDLLENFQQNADIIVSNPPYIANSYPLDDFVKKEPKIALFGGEKGDEILKRLIAQSADKTKFLICEMGYDQKISMQKELEKFNFKAEFYKDLAGFDRGFIAKKL